VFRSRRYPATRLHLVMHRHPQPSTHPNRKALQALTRLAANRHRSPARHRPSTRRPHRSLPGMAWPNRGVTATTRRTRATSRLHRATPDLRMRGRTRQRTISPLTHPLLNLPARTNDRLRTAASRANHRTRLVTSTPGLTSRQQRRRLPWPGVCPWRRTPLGQFTVRRMVARLGHRPQSPRHARPNPRRRKPVHRTVRAPRHLRVPGQERVARRRLRSIRR
jgi:hypothetical protein